MAKTNYSFEKRQRELAKKKKQDEKDAKKRGARASAAVDTHQPRAMPAPAPPQAPAPPAEAGPKIHRRPGSVG